MNENPLDSLNDDDADAAPSASPSPVPSASPRESGDMGGDTLKAQALAGLPTEWRERLIADAGAAGVRHDNDVGWLLVGSVVHSAMAAFAAGNAAQAVQAAASNIPDQIFQSAGRASDEVKGVLVSGGKLFAAAFTKAANDRQAAFVTSAADQQKGILDAAAVGAEKIKTAATTLTVSLDAAVAAKKAEGVGEFAKAAALAGERAAKASMAAQLSRSALVSVLAFAFAALIGAGGLWGWLLITHRVMPAGVTAVWNPLDNRTVVILPDGDHAALPAPIPDLP